MFNLRRLKNNRIKSFNSTKNSSFLHSIHEDILERLIPLDKKFNRILIIEPAIQEIINNYFKIISSKSNIIYTYDLTDKLENRKFDLILFPFGFHWVNDVRLFLEKIRLILEKNGIFICSFPGGGSLRNLRIRLIELEILNKVSHTPHISPFIQHEHMNTLLYQSGFKESIIDMTSIQLRHNSPFDLMQDIKYHGESNVLKNNSGYCITKKMYRDLKNIAPTPFTDHINLLTFVATIEKGSVKLKKTYYK